MFYVYILVSLVDGSLYTRQTDNLLNRLERHNSGRVHSSKSKAPFRLAYFEEFETRSGAMRREWELKTKWNTERKKKLIATFDQERLPTLSNTSA